MAGPTTLSLPSFAGATRRLILINLAVFFALAILGIFSRNGEALLVGHLLLTPEDVVHGQIWQLLTYSFINPGLLQIAFGLLSLWFIGSWLEGSFGARWLYELYLTSAMGAALLATLISFAHVGISPLSIGIGLNSAVFGLLIAVARYFGDQEISLMFLIRLKAKYLVAIYILFYLALLLRDGNRFDALVQLCGAASAWLFLRFVPRKGLSYLATEKMYSLRNEYYRSKRRRAAKQFEVYMGKQGREVRFDNQGRYIDPDENKNPTDKKWMN